MVMNKFDDDADVFADVHADRKLLGANRRNNKKQKKESERRVKTLEGKERWRFNPNRSYEDD
jgi:hypothetical protein